MNYRDATHLKIENNCFSTDSVATMWLLILYLEENNLLDLVGGPVDAGDQA